MAVWRHLTRGLRVLARRAAADRELDDELRHWLEEATAQHVARGLPPDAARRAAAAEIGPATLVRERVRDHGWEQWLASWLQDLRLAGRALRRTPVFAAIVVLVVALGSGAVATVFSAMNAILLRPIPGVGEPGGLIALQPASRAGGTGEQVSYARYVALRDGARTVDGLAAWGRAPLTIAADGAGAAVLGNLVTANYFDVLRVTPVAGRFFTAADAAGAEGDVLVVSDAFWRAHLGGEHRAVGRRLLVNGHPFTLVGVAPPAFRGLYTGLGIDAWAPLVAQPRLRPRTNLTDATWLWAFGRLAAGATPDAAAGELSALAQAHRRAIGAPDSPAAFAAMRVAPLTGLPGGRDGIAAFLAVLLAAAVLVLIIAGVNVAALLAARHAAGARDLAVRAALGAGRLRLIRQLLTEVGVLFLAGGFGGFALAIVATSALERLPLPGSIRVTLEISPDLRVLAAALGLTLIAAVVFGVGPALQGVRRDVVDRLKRDTAGSGVRRSWIGRALIAGQLALSLVLLVAAGLFVRAVDRGARVDPGFDARGVTTTLLEPESWGYDEARTDAFYQRLRERLAGAPGVASVGFASRLPLMFGSSVDAIDIGGGTLDAHYVAVDGGYFDALRLPIVSGRAFAPADRDGSARVAVVNETLARLVAPGGDPIGRAIRFRDHETTVVGVARDARYASLDEATPPFLYVPLAQVRHPARAALVRTVSGGSAAGVIAAAVRELDPKAPPARESLLADETRIVLFPQRVAAIVTAALGATGLALATLGLYGTVAASAARRTREIGIRLALGAARGAVLRGVVGEGARLAAAGLALGLPLAAAATPLLRQWLFDVDPLDVPTFVVLSVVLLGVAGVASYVPARRAAATDPLQALRAD